VRESDADDFSRVTQRPRNTLENENQGRKGARVGEDRSHLVPLSPAIREAAANALGLIPAAPFLLSSCFEGRRAGVVVRTVQLCATDPLLVSIALRRGHWIEPIIRDSRCFGVHMLDADDRLLLRKFDFDAKREATDPFDCVPSETLVSNSPAPTRARMSIDCEVVRHFDLEADHSLYVGQIIAAKIRTNGQAGK